ncbi:hypothetical protein JCM5353_000877 [Sporobolomyces roseus]
MASGATYNVTRFTRQVLKRHRRAPPSIVVHLYPNHFRFEHSIGNFSYDHPIKCFLEAIREQKLPTDLLDLLDQSNVVYYDGCLIVEVHDHRQNATPITAHPLSKSKIFSFSITPSSQQDSPYNQKAEVYRIVLGPNPATLWTELGILSSRIEDEAIAQGREGGGEGFSQEQAVKMEAVILNRTLPPLCLDPSIQTSRIANSMLRATTLRPPKRKRFCSSGDCDDASHNHSHSPTMANSAEGREKRELEEHEKLMKVGDEGILKTKGPAFSRLAFIQSYRERQSNPHAHQAQLKSTSASAPPAPSSASLTAQPGSAITSIRLGGSHAASSHQQQPSGSRGASQTPRAASPAASVTSQAQRQKKRSSAAIAAAAAEMSDGNQSVSSQIGGAGGGGGLTAAQLKKQRKAAQQALIDSQDPTLPQDPVEREKVLVERRKEEKKKASAKRKEKKRLEELQAAQREQQGLAAGGGGPAVQAKFTWSGK